ncbi:MAG: TatD family hydrolase [Alphaproteobacteria bacterium]|nr:TatD family hydrolase [Alphaproteobacteria bacterium]
MLVDHHCHLDFPDFSDDLAGVVARAGAAGVGLMVTISTRIRAFDQVLAVANQFDNVFCSVGTHPHNAHEELDIPVEEIVRLSANPKVVAIGEAGLDFHYDHSSPDAQEQGFRNHIAAARETGLPLEIHARSADEQTIAILEDELKSGGAFPAILHCFTGGKKMAYRAVDLGFTVSFSGIVSFKGAPELREIAAELPLDAILVETDAPYLAPVPFRGKTNEPAYVAHTAKAVAEARKIEVEALAAATTNNFFKLFKKVPRSAFASVEGA